MELLRVAATVLLKVMAVSRVKVFKFKEDLKLGSEVMASKLSDLKLVSEVMAFKLSDLKLDNL